MNDATRRLARLGLLASLLLTACGGGGSAATAGASGPASSAEASGPGTGAGESPAGAGGDGGYDELPAPCNLLTEAEIRSITGYGIERTSFSEDPGEIGELDVSCTWDLDGPEPTEDAIAVGVRLTGGREAFEERRAFLEDAPTVDGIGDDAIREEPMVIGSVTGDIYIDVTYFTVDESPEQATFELIKAITDDL